MKKRLLMGLLATFLLVAMVGLVGCTDERDEEPTPGQTENIMPDNPENSDNQVIIDDDGEGFTGGPGQSIRPPDAVSDGQQTIVVDPNAPGNGHSGEVVDEVVIGE